MIAIRVCPICKKVFEGRVGVPKVYCDECTMFEDLAASDTAKEQSAWFFEDTGKTEKENTGLDETKQEKIFDTPVDESRLPTAPRQNRESLLLLISPKRTSKRS